jgi:hypothetical protein
VYGSHVGFASGRYRPGTAGGELLLAHELAHVAQQRDSEDQGPIGRAGAALEADADQAAGAAFLGQTAQPALRSRLTLGLTSCFKSGPSARTRQETFWDLLRDPEANRQQLLDLLNDDDNIDAVADIRSFYNDNTIRTVARTSLAAREVLGRLADRLHDRGRTGEEATVRGVVTELGRSTPDPAAGTAELSELQRLRRALAADTRHAAHFASIGLDVANIEIYDFRRALAGRVYYDPTLDRESTSSDVTAGETAVAVSGPAQETFRLGAIRIGPHGVRGRSDEFIRSAVFHEALHRTLHIDAMRGAGATDARTRDLRAELFARTSGSNASPNEETEVLSRQIEIDVLPMLEVRDERNRPRNDEAAIMFNSLAGPFPRANPDFRRAAVDRIVRTLTGHPPELRRVLAILRALPEPQHRALAELEQALTALAPAAPTRRPDRGARP